jgi:hypothetical protein
MVWFYPDPEPMAPPPPEPVEGPSGLSREQAGALATLGFLAIICLLIATIPQSGGLTYRESRSPEGEEGDEAASRSD